jgi:hypothetical protein
MHERKAMKFAKRRIADPLKDVSEGVMSGQSPPTSTLTSRLHIMSDSTSYQISLENSPTTPPMPPSEFMQGPTYKVEGGSSPPQIRNQMRGLGVVSSGVANDRRGGSPSRGGVGNKYEINVK